VLAVLCDESVCIDLGFEARVWKRCCKMNAHWLESAGVCLICCGGALVNFCAVLYMQTWFSPTFPDRRVPLTCQTC
jgi:hypothetical protein